MSQTYTARAGDTWASLAFALYSDEAKMDALLAVNPLLSHLLVFAGGEPVNIPDEVPEDTSADLPPWRR